MMRAPPFFLFFLSLTLSVMGPTLASSTHVWSQRFGGIYHESGDGVAVDAAGNVFVTGIFFYATDLGGGQLFSAGSFDIFLAKYDTHGSHLWSKRFGGTSVYDYGRSVAVDPSGNVFLTGNFEQTVDFGGGNLTSVGEGDIFLAKYDAHGSHLWSRRFGSVVEDRGNALAADHSGNVWVTGYFQRTVDFGGGPLVSAGSEDMFLAKYDADGDHLASVRFGLGLSDHGQAVAVDGSGNALVTGDYYHSTSDRITPWYQEQVFVNKYDAGGAQLWSRQFGGLEGDYGNGVTVDVDGNVVATGTFRQTVDFGGGPTVSAGGFDVFLAKYAPDGAHLWSRRFGGASFEQGFSVAAGAAASVWLAGRFGGTTDFGGGSLSSAGQSDMFLAQYDANGAHMWSQGVGSDESDSPGMLTVDAAGNALVTGYFMGSVDFGGGALVSAGSPDIFLAKYSAGTVAVAITAFNALAKGHEVELQAMFRSDLGVGAVNVYRGVSKSALARIASVSPVGSDRFVYVDRDVQTGTTYHYQIGVVDESGEFFSSVAAVSMELVAARLEQNTPNPFNPSTHIRFSVSDQTRLIVSVYDTNGMLVRVLIDETREPGSYSAEWDGRDAHGVPVSSGVYFCRLQAGKFTDSKKMVLVK